VTRVIALPRALPGKTCAVTIARETRWDSPSEVLNQPGLGSESVAVDVWIPGGITQINGYRN
jgi:hypothetical protein